MHHSLKNSIRSTLATSLLVSGWTLIGATAAWSDNGGFCYGNDVPYNGTCWKSTDTATNPNCQTNFIPGQAGCYIQDGQTNSNALNAASTPNQLNRLNTENNSDNSNSKCKKSESIDAKFSCDTTENLATYSQITNVAGQAVGSMTTQYAGIQNTATAQSTGTMAATYEAAANTAKVSAYSDAGVGAMNVAMGALQIKDAMDHSDYHDELAKTAGVAKSAFVDNPAAAAAGAAGKGKVPNQVIYKQGTDGNLNSIVEQGIAANGNSTTGFYQAQSSAATASQQASRLANSAASEQKTDASKGKMAAAATLITGAQSILKAGIDYMAAEQYEKAAQTLSATAATGAVFSPTWEH